MNTEKDLQYIENCPSIDWEQFRNKSVLITGATGLIGSWLVNTLTHVSKKKDLHCAVYAQIRNMEKARRMLDDCDSIGFVVGNIETLKEEDTQFDFIFHCASPTDSRMMVNQPVDVIRAALLGTMNMLEVARRDHSTFIYLSSMEVYGTPSTDEKIAENHSSNLNQMEVRSSYPESKRMCENLCVSYHKQYEVPARVVRLTQTMGPGIQYNDRRVFAEFARCAIEGSNIVLKTKGETRRNYLYTADAASAILTVATRGEDGQAYNAANEDTYCSIYEFAQMVAHDIAEDLIKVVIEETNDIQKFGFAPTLKMNLDTAKLRSLGWKAGYSLQDALERTIEAMKETR